MEFRSAIVAVGMLTSAMVAVVPADARPGCHHRRPIHHRPIHHRPMYHRPMHHR